MRKAPAIICDIDGTLAHHVGRSPYDATKYHTDVVDTSIKALLDGARRGFHILLVSGRDSRYRPSTVDWLFKNDIQYTRLYMRREGDKRKDHEVKMELYFRYIEPDYNVICVIDDRNRVVQMWREIGLKCLQAQPGDF